MTKPPVVLVDKERRKITVGKKTVRLTPKEFGIFVFLSETRRMLPRWEIGPRVWGKKWNHRISSRTIDQHIRRIRAKLGDGIIETVPCSGYIYIGA